MNAWTRSADLAAATKRTVDALSSMLAGGPGSGRKPGGAVKKGYDKYGVHNATGKTDAEFRQISNKIAALRNATRATEDRLHSEGKHEEGNALYQKAKDAYVAYAKTTGITPAAFDQHFKDMANKHGLMPPKLKMANVHGDSW